MYPSAAITSPKTTFDLQPAFLSLVNLTRYYDTLAAVKDLSLEVKEGEYITLLGPSGCGKTTTLRMIAGFVPPSSGAILLDGQDIGTLPPEKRPVNTVFQDYALFPHLTVEQNVAYGLQVRGTARAEINERVKDMLDRVQIADLAQRYPRYLSGGQQQRVALARALVCRPRMLLLDEPLGALDARLREQMQIVLKDLQRELNIAFIHVTHDQSEAMALADRIVVMRNGVIEQVDTPEHLYHRPVNGFVADFLGTTNLFKGQCIYQDGDVVVLQVDNYEMRGQSLLGFVPGEQVHISVRPSAIQVNPIASMPNHFKGEVEGAVYRGENWVLRIKVPPFQINAITTAQWDNYGMQVGELVNVGWRVEDCWLMKVEA